ncbi:MAG TPA: pseudouridine synthase [Candidatus Omnitrophota bacterium]|nr:pseudouridine synthase [Candidatus Omnitrophota bacterium]HPS36365.1 pseudouridine synthase [Candidatus Omnitrophota bacterium]
MRISHALASAGLGSRRKCEVFVTNGAISVNGEVVRDLGRQVDFEKDTIMYRSKVLQAAPHVYYIMNKPEGYVVTAQDVHAKKTVFELLPRHLVNATRQASTNRVRVFPVGRLDKDSSGLLLMTNDGELGNKLIHPRYHVEKWYEVKLNRAWAPQDRNKMLNGFHSYDGILKLEDLRPISVRGVLVELREGKKRQIRRVFKRFGYEVVYLNRISFGPLKLGGLPLGQGRFLTSFESRELRKAVNL